MPTPFGLALLLDVCISKDIRKQASLDGRAKSFILFANNDSSV